MIKIIGIILLSCSVSAYGAYKSDFYRQRCRIRMEFLDFMRQVENGIKYGGMSLEKIFGSYSSPLLDKKGFTAALRLGNHPGIVSSTLPMLSENEKTMAEDFLSSLGKSRYRERETELCSGFIALFSEKAKTFQKEDETKILLYKKLGLLAALLTAVIFI